VYTAQSARFDRLRQFWPQDDVDDVAYRLVRVPIGENSTASSPATSGCPNHLVSTPAWLPASRYGPKTTLMTPITGWSVRYTCCAPTKSAPNAKLRLYAKFQLRSSSECKSPAANTQTDRQTDRQTDGQTELRAPPGNFWSQNLELLRGPRARSSKSGLFDLVGWSLTQRCPYILEEDTLGYTALLLDF
jgi:hypothetical protein